MHKEEILIRNATLKDVWFIDYAQQEIGEIERPLDPLLKRRGRIRFDKVKTLRGLIVSRSGLMLIAESGGKPVGCVTVKVKKNDLNFCSNPRRITINSLFVEKGFRGKGVGRRLLTMAMEWSKRSGIKEIWLEVYRENEIPLSMYKKMGFKEHNCLNLVYIP